MKTIIATDPHTHTDYLDVIYDKFPTDQKIVNGDFFDTWNDTPDQNAAMAEWVKAHIDDPLSTFHFGNHDMPYCPLFGMLSQDFLYCSGYSIGKDRAINNVLSLDDWKKLKFFSVVQSDQPWLISHAGIHPAYFAEPSLQDLERRIAELQHSLRTGNRDPLAGAGRSRGGDQYVGGMTWLDWDEFEPIPGIRQLVGHTRGKTVREKDGNFCFDTNATTYAIIDEDGSVSFEKI